MALTPEVSTHPNLDHGWAWMVLAGCFLTNAILLGQIYSFSVYFVVFLQLFEESRSYTAWIGSLSLGVFQLASISSGFFIPRMGARKTSILGGFIAALGFLISSFATNIPYLMFSYGIVVAFGLSISFYGCLEAMSQFFKRYLFAAMGFGMSGGGVGLMIVPYLMPWLLDTYGWRGALLMQAGLSLNICACASLFFPIKNPKLVQPQKGCDFGSSTECLSNVADAPPTALLTWLQRTTEPRIGILALASLLQGVGVLTLYVIYKDFAMFCGFADMYPHAMLAMGVGNIFGRFLTGVITSYVCPVIYFVAVSALCALVLFLNYVNVVPELFVVLGALFGYGHGSTSSGMPLVVASLFGRQEVAVTLGYLMFFAGIGTLFGSPLAGYLVDQTGSYFGCFMLSGSFLIGSTCLSTTLFFFNTRRLQKKSVES